METKICKKCGEEKSVEEFEIENVVKGVHYRRRDCKLCRQEIREERRQKMRDWFEEFRQDLKCKECGVSEFYLLDFHHRDPKEKEMEVSIAVTSGWGKKRILEEIAKCDIYCANCHRRYHYFEKQNN